MNIAIRWFLRLSIDEKGPDASTISYFRIHRMTEEDTQYFFNEIVKLGIERGVVKTQRFIVDTTDVAANVNYPSEHRLLYSANNNLIKQIEKHDVITAINLKSDLDDAFEALNEYESKYSTKDLAHVF